MAYQPQPSQYPMQAQPPPAYTAQPQPGYPVSPHPVSLKGYQPYPVRSQQSSTSNVVVVNQPAVTQAPTIVTAVGPKPQDYFILSLVALGLCFFHGNWLTFFCLIPALVFSLSSQSHAARGNYSSAKSMGQAALGCNIAAFVFYAVFFVLAVIVLGVYYGMFYSINIDTGGCYDVYDPYLHQYTQVCA